MWKYLRVLLLVALLLASIRAGYRVATNLFALLDFQIALYKIIIQTQSSVTATRDSVQQGIGEAANFFWLGDGSPSSGKSELLVADRVASYSQQLRKISNIFGCLTAVLVFKVGFDILFWVKTLWRRIQAFILE